MCNVVLPYLGEESVKKVRRTSSVDSADHDVIMAAGESSKTDLTAFIEQQQKMLHEFKSSKVSASKGNDVVMRNDEKTDSASSLSFRDDLYRNTPAVAAGESSKTDPTAFIEQQQKMLHELKSSKLIASKGNDVVMRNEEKTDSASCLNFRDDLYRNTPPDSVLRSNPPITRQPGSSDVGTRWYADYDLIEKEECEKSVQHESNRCGKSSSPRSAFQLVE